MSGLEWPLDRLKVIEDQVENKKDLLESINKDKYVASANIVNVFEEKEQPETKNKTMSVADQLLELLD